MTEERKDSHPLSLEEIAEKKRQDALRNHKEQVKNLMDQIKSLQTKQEELELLLKNFQESYNKLDESRSAVKEKKNILKDTLQKLSDVQFTREDLQESAEMKNIQTARAEVRTDIHNLKTKKGEISSQIPSLVEKKKIAKIPKKTGEKKEILPTKNAIISAIETQIADIKNKIKELEEQTPEGQAKKREGCKEVLLKNRLKPYFLRLPLEEIFLVTHPDLAVAEKYGEDMVKDILVEFFNQRVDERKEEEKERQGQNITNIDNIAQKIKDKLPKKIDLDWVNMVLRNFTDQHQNLIEIEKHYNDLEKNQPKIEQARKFLEKIKAKYQIILEDIFDASFIHDQKQSFHWVNVKAEVEEIQKKKNTLDIEIRMLNDQISTKIGLLERISQKKYDKRIEEIKPKLLQKQKDKTELEQDLQEKTQLRLDFSEKIQEIIKIVNFDFKKEIMRYNYKIDIFLDIADKYLLKKIEGDLSEEEKNVYQQFLQIHQAKQTAEENYKKSK